MLPCTAEPWVQVAVRPTLLSAAWTRATHCPLPKYWLSYCEWFVATEPAPLPEEGVRSDSVGSLVVEPVVVEPGNMVLPFGDVKVGAPVS